jgi:hypothetical protein
VKWRVQHYGYVFDYEIANVLRDRNGITSDDNNGDTDNGDGISNKACCPPMPALPDNTSSSWSMDELNEFF